ETFKSLGAVHPGRIGLGLGRAPGAEGITAYAMRRSREALSADDYPEQLAGLFAFDEENFPADHPFRSIRAIPFDVRMPPVWILGSSPWSSALAASNGLPYSFASHINGAGAVSALRSYRANFVPSARLERPHSMLALSVTIGETPEHAEALNQINKLMLVRLHQSFTDRLYPTLEEALAYQFTPAEEALIASRPLR